MRIIVLGTSSFVIDSRGRLISWILEHFKNSEHEVAAIVWNHNIEYLVPETTEKGPVWFYECASDEGPKRVRIFPLLPEKDRAAMVHDLLSFLKPDVLLTVGDVSDFVYLPALKQFYSGDLRWLFVATNYSLPLSGDYLDIVRAADHIVSTNRATVSSLEASSCIENVTYISPGYNEMDFYQDDVHDHDGQELRIMASGKNLQTDNLAAAMEAVQISRSRGIDAKLYVHSNVTDLGDYDFNALKDRFDGPEAYIRFPERFVSIYDGISQQEMRNELNWADVFLSTSVVSATSMSAMEAVACGAFPLMSHCGSNSELAGDLEKSSEGMIKTQDLLVKTTRFMTKGGVYLNICDPKDVADKLVRLNRFFRNRQGRREVLEQSRLRLKSSRRAFLDALSSLVDEVGNREQAMCLETITGGS